MKTSIKDKPEAARDSYSDNMYRGENPPDQSPKYQAPNRNDKSSKPSGQQVNGAGHGAPVRGGAAN